MVGPGLNEIQWLRDQAELPGRRDRLLVWTIIGVAFAGSRRRAPANLHLRLLPPSLFAFGIAFRALRLLRGLALWDARPGDEVFVSTPDGRVLPYVVHDVLPRVAPTDVSSTRPTTTERLTLQTSTGPSPSDPRFVVFAFPRGG